MTIDFALGFALGFARLDVSLLSPDKEVLVVAGCVIFGDLICEPGRRDRDDTITNFIGAILIERLTLFTVSKPAIGCFAIFRAKPFFLLRPGISSGAGWAASFPACISIDAHV